MRITKILFLVLGSVLFVGLGASQSTAITDFSPNDGFQQHHDENISFVISTEANTDTVLELYIDGSLNQTFQPINGATSLFNYTINPSPKDIGDITYDAVLYEDGGDGTIFSDPSQRTLTVLGDASQLTTFNYNSPSDGEQFFSDINRERDITLETSIATPKGGNVEFYVDNTLVNEDNNIPESFSTTSTHTETISDGSHEFYAKYVGDDGTSTQLSPISFDVLNYAERSSISLETPADGEVFDNSAFLTYNISAGPDGTVNLVVDGTVRETYDYTASNVNSYSSTLTDLNEGSHSWYVEYVGDDGSSTQTETRNFNINAPPSIDSISVDNNNPVVNEDIDISLSFSDDLGLQLYQLNVKNPSGTEVASTSGIISGTSDTAQENNLFQPSVQGTYNITVTAFDADGGQNTSSNTFSVSTESSPVFNPDSPENNDVIQTPLGQDTVDIDFTGNINSDFSGDKSIIIDGGQRNSRTLSSGGDTYNFTETVSKGSHTYTVEAFSSSSGITYSSGTRNFDVVDQDQTPPISFNNWTFSGFQDQGSATVKITADDGAGVGVSNLSYRVNSGTLQTVQSNDTTITLNNEGNNTLEFYGVDENGNQESINTDYIAFEKQNNITVDIDTNVSTIKTGETVLFNASNSSDSDGTITGYSWDLDNDGVFGDSTGALASKSFSNIGTSKVVVNISSSSGFFKTASETINVQNRIPNASFSFSTDDLQINADASESSDPDGNIVNYQWDWTNDLSFDDSGQIADHNYSSDGNYNVKLTVTDDNGDIDTEIKTVSVSQGGSGGQPPSFGGGGGSSDDEIDTTTVFFNSEAQPTETVTVPINQQVERDLFITNTVRRNLSVDVSKGNSNVCDLIQVEKSFVNGEFGESGEYQLPQATENFGTLEVSVSTSLKINSPIREEIEENNLRELSCEFDTDSSYGQAEDLEIKLEFNDSLISQILNLLQSSVFEIPLANFSSGDPEVQDTIEVKIWMMLAALLVVLNLYLIRK